MSSEVDSLVLGDVVSLVRGTTYKSALLGRPGPVLLGLASIQRNGGFRSDSLKTYGGESKGKLLLKPGDLFVSLKDVTQSADLLGAIARVPPSVSCGRLTQDTVRLDFNRGSYPGNLVYWVLRTPQFRSHCREHATGTTNLGLSRDDFLAFPLPPSNDSALSLVEMLDALDDRIDNLRATNATLEAIAQAIFKSWFIDFDPVRAKMEGREPEGMDAETAALFPSEFEESELGLIPRGWDCGSISNLGGMSSGRRPPTRHQAPSDSAFVPVFGGSGVMAYTEEPLEREPLILTGRVGAIGTVHHITQECWPSDNTLLLKPAKWFEFALQHLRQVDFALITKGSTQPMITQTDLKSSPIIMPPDRLVASYESLVLPIRQKIVNVNKECECLSSMRDHLLPRLICGKLRLAA